MTISTEALRAVRDAAPLRHARHAAASSDHLDRPEGSPEGPCEACGSETGPMQPYVATGVYSPYALCADTEACKARQAARSDRAEGEQEAGEDVPGPLVTCAACGHDAPHTGMLNATCTEGECGCDGPCTGDEEDGSDDAGDAASRS